MVNGHSGKVTQYKKHLPLCKVCFPPDNTPTGRVPVGVRPLSVNTLSLSSLVQNNTQVHEEHTQFTFQQAQRPTPGGLEAVFKPRGHEVTGCFTCSVSSTLCLVRWTICTNRLQPTCYHVPCFCNWVTDNLCQF